MEELKKMLVGQTHNAARSFALSAPQRKSFPAVCTAEANRWRNEEERQHPSLAENRRKKSQKGEKTRKYLGERPATASAAEEKAGRDGRWRWPELGSARVLAALQPRWRAPFSGRAGTPRQTFLPGSGAQLFQLEEGFLILGCNSRRVLRVARRVLRVFGGLMGRMLRMSRILNYLGIKITDSNISEGGRQRLNFRQTFVSTFQVSILSLFLNFQHFNFYQQTMQLCFGQTVVRTGLGIQLMRTTWQSWHPTSSAVAVAVSCFETWIYKREKRRTIPPGNHGVGHPRLLLLSLLLLLFLK